MPAEKRFTIGQFAKLHGVNKKTLMWYDQVGLLKPAAVSDNGYRYYTYSQSALLETILMLRELNVSIAEIAVFLRVRSAASLETLLADKGAELDETISHLKAVRAVVEEKRQTLAAIQSLDLSAFSIVEKTETHYLAAVPISPGLPLEQEIELVVAEAEKHRLRRLHDASYGAMLPAERLYQGDFDGYSALFIELPRPARRKGLHIQPKGKYLRTYCKGGWDKLPGRYREILTYAGAQGLAFCGCAYEKGINEAVIASRDDYITQIEIPLRCT